MTTLLRSRVIIVDESDDKTRGEGRSTFASASASMVLSSLDNYIDVDADVERRKCCSGGYCR